VSIAKASGGLDGREFHESLFSSPSQNAAQAAQATASASDAQIAQEEQYVSGSEQQLRGAIAGLGPNPYFTAPAAPAAVNPANTTNFFSPTPQKGAPAQGARAGAPPANFFSAPPPQGQQRQAMPVARAAGQ
jgi:hypothetical protein